MENILIISLSTMGGVALILSCGLAIANRKLKVSEDPRVEQIVNILPNINCGACGFSGCYGYSESIVKEKIGINICTPGGTDVTNNISEIMGVEATQKEKQIAIVCCQGGKEESKNRFVYQGISTCKASNLTAGGHKACIYGCLGFGDCLKACPFNAIRLSDNCLPVIDEEKCTGCGLCVKSCPRNIIGLIPESQKVYLGCVSLDKGKVVKEFCKVGCFGCTLCASPKVTPDEVIIMKGNLPAVMLEKIKDWNILNNAIAKCPAKCFKVKKGGGYG